MTAPFDLAEVQRRRDAELAAGRRIVAERADALAEAILRWSGRADQARVKLSGADAEAAYSVSRWARRRLRGEAKRLIGKAVPEAVRVDVVELAAAAYDQRLRALEVGQ